MWSTWMVKCYVVRNSDLRTNAKKRKNAFTANLHEIKNNSVLVHKWKIWTKIFRGGLSRIVEN